MLIFPAIDLLNGRVVRLFQGDYEKVSVFDNTAAAYAGMFSEQGAEHLHVVDLEGAKAGAVRNLETIREIIDAVPKMFIEFGGGVRDEATAERCFSLGISRVILGTAALRDKDFTKRMVKKYGQKIAVGVDARNRRVAVEGWLSTSEADSVDFCKEMRDIGVGYIIYTDISKDGAGKGTNLEIYRELSRIEGVCFTASGGVSSSEDIYALRDTGIYAAILGRALYTGDIKLKDAIDAAKPQ